MNEYLYLLLNGLEQDQSGIDQRHGYWSEQSLRCAARIQRLRVQLGIESEYESISEAEGIAEESYEAATGFTTGGHNSERGDEDSEQSYYDNSNQPSCEHCEECGASMDECNCDIPF